MGTDISWSGLRERKLSHKEDIRKDKEELLVINIPEKNIFSCNIVDIKKDSKK